MLMAGEENMRSKREVLSSALRACVSAGDEFQVWFKNNALGEDWEEYWKETNGAAWQTLRTTNEASYYATTRWGIHSLTKIQSQLKPSHEIMAQKS